MAKNDGIKFKLAFSSRWATSPRKPRPGLSVKGQTMEIYKPRDEYCAKT